MASSEQVKSSRSREVQRAAARGKANVRRAEITDLKQEARSGRLDVSALLQDPRADAVKVLTVLVMVPRCTQRTALQALLDCQINGADTCGDLTAADRERIANALGHLQTGRGRRSAGPATGPRSGVDRALDRTIEATKKVEPVVELRPSEFAAARNGLERDPQLLRMLDRLVAALRVYVDRDDGGFLARVVLDQWLRFRNYRGRVARGELPPPSCTSVEVE